MSVESSTYISQLNPDAPTGSEKKYEGDNHFRNIKSCLQSQFPNLGLNPVNATAVELSYMVDFTGATIPATWTYFGTAATLDFGNDIGDVVQVVSVSGDQAGLPALDGSRLTGINTTSQLVADIEIDDLKDGLFVTYFLGNS